MLQIVLKGEQGENIIQVSMVTQVLELWYVCNLGMRPSLLLSSLHWMRYHTCFVHVQIELQGSRFIRHMLSPLE